jgi:hypothetical protein
MQDVGFSRLAFLGRMRVARELERGADAPELLFRYSLGHDVEHMAGLLLYDVVVICLHGCKFAHFF